MRRVGVARRWWLVGALAWGAGLLAPEAPTAPARASELPTFNVQLPPVATTLTGEAFLSTESARVTGQCQGVSTFTAGGSAFGPVNGKYEESGSFTFDSTGRLSKFDATFTILPSSQELVPTPVTGTMTLDPAIEAVCGEGTSLVAQVRYTVTSPTQIVETGSVQVSMSSPCCFGANQFMAGPPSAADLAAAMTRAPELVTGASYLTGPLFTTDPQAMSTAVAGAPLASFPVAGPTYAVMSTGDARAAVPTQPGPIADFNLDWGSAEERGNQAFDVTVLRVNLNVPQGDNCLAFDFRFLSSEFPELVNSSSSDAFIAELDKSTWTTDGSAISAPKNFASDSAGHVITIQATGDASMSADEAANTPYGGATPLLTATTPVTPGPHALYLSIFDRGDLQLASTVFLDNLRAGITRADCTRGAHRAATAVPDSVTAQSGVPTVFDVLANDLSVTHQPVTVTLKPEPEQGPEHGAAHVNPDGTITYTSAPAYVGHDGFSYSVGGSDAPVAVTVVPPPTFAPSPVVHDDAASAVTGQPAVIAVLANDSGTESLPVTVAVAPGHGTAAVNPDRTVTYRSALGYVGTDSFTYSVGGVSATVTVTVAPVQIHLSTPADHPLTFDLLSLDPNAAGVLTARSALLVAASTKAGVVQAASAPATVALTGAPGHGSAAVDPSGTVTYTPSAGFTGQDSFPYRLVSGASPISVGTVGMKVVNPESPPAPSPATITPDVVGPPSPQAGGGPSVAVLGEQVVRDAPSSSRSPAPSPPSPAAAPSPPAAAAAPAPPDGGPVSDGRPPALIEQPAPSIAPVEAGRFFAVASRGRQASGPPGAGLDLGVTGYPSPCKTVYFFFDATRIGSAHPDANGDIVEKGLSVPGDTRPGAHTLSASCDPSRRTVLRSQPFSVDRVGLHRSSFVTSLPRPGRVPFSAKAIALSVAIAAGLMLLIAFPCELFNASLEEHYEEIRRWFRFKERALHSIGRRRQATAFVAFVAIGGGLYSMLDPRFGLNESSAGLALGMALGLIAVTFGFSVPVIIYMRRRHRDWGEVRVLPGGLVIAAACVLLSRLLHFQPGYLYGLIAGVAYHRELTRDTEGRITALSTLSMMALSLLAWLAWATLSQTAARSNPGLGLVVAETVLATVFAFGLETAVFGLLPLRFMAGSKIVAWNRWAWAAVFGLGLFGFVHILLRPGTGYVSTVGPGGVATVVGMLVGFGVLSVVLWGYFRFRPARQELAEEEFVGTAGVEL